ncbi:TPA: TraM recognition domain-containing protein, partial [Neisseria gonorrhoeae]
DVWTESGMNKLWSAANMKIYGGGVSEKPFLESLSALLGSYDRKTGSVSINQGQGRGRSVSHQLTRERILDVDELGALPKGRAVVLASGSRPTLIRTEPWMLGPHAAEVKASLRAHDPQAGETIDEAERQVAEVAASEGTA